MDMTSLSDRKKLRDVVGEKAEQTIYNFCDTNRQKAMPLGITLSLPASSQLKFEQTTLEQKALSY